MERVEEIRKKLEALLTEAIELLEKEYDLDKAKTNNQAYSIMIDVNSAMLQLDFLDDDCLKPEKQ